MWRQLLSEYGMLIVLVLLGALFSILTWAEQQPVGMAAAEQVLDQLTSLADLRQERLLIVVRDHLDDRTYAHELTSGLTAAGVEAVEVVVGQPADARQKLDELVSRNGRLDRIICSSASATWGIFAKIENTFPVLGKVAIVAPHSYRWPNFLKRDNLLNIANQISVIAMVAIGMTMVIIAGGIDLSVGSLIALSAVVATRLIRDYGGAEQATVWTMVPCCTVAIVLCGAAGAVTGVVTTGLRVPPFIVTLAMMLIASGAAYMLAAGQSINQVPDSFVWLGRGAELYGIPNSVILMLGLYGAAHIVMSRTTMGRYLYAVGGNAEAARLSGVTTHRVIVFSFLISGLLAGLGGIVLASQLKSGSPTYGQMYELYVIAAVVVGGTSLAGGEGKVLGTLIGAFIIAVIQNGMNLMGIESYTQKVVLGAVILSAVIVDRLRHQISS